MNEKLLYYLWQQQLTHKPMMTTDQRELVVVQVGQRNQNSGPDFLYAQLQLDKMTWGWTCGNALQKLGLVHPQPSYR
jgi:hypothetical protein